MPLSAIPFQISSRHLIQFRASGKKTIAFFHKIRAQPSFGFLNSSLSSLPRLFLLLVVFLSFLPKYLGEKIRAHALSSSLLCPVKDRFDIFSHFSLSYRPSVMAIRFALCLVQNAKHKRRGAINYVIILVDTVIDTSDQ